MIKFDNSLSEEQKNEYEEILTENLYQILKLNVLMSLPKEQPIKTVGMYMFLNKNIITLKFHRFRLKFRFNRFLMQGKLKDYNMFLSIELPYKIKSAEEEFGLEFSDKLKIYYHGPYKENILFYCFQKGYKINDDDDFNLLINNFIEKKISLI